MSALARCKRPRSLLSPSSPPAARSWLPASLREHRALLAALRSTLSFSSLPACTDALPARTAHLNLVAAFVLAALTDRRDARRALYVCGRPGCGKTASVLTVLQRVFDFSEINGAKLCPAAPRRPAALIVAINAMTAASPAACLRQILTSASAAAGDVRALSVSDTASAPLMAEFRTFVRSSRTAGRTCVLVVDELDALLPTFRARTRTAKDTEARAVIQFLFELAAARELVLVALSNDINLIDALKGELQPKKLVFACYETREIQDILAERLRRGARDAHCAIDDDHIPLFDASALQFVASAAASAGDVRASLKLALSCVSACSESSIPVTPISALTVAKVKSALTAAIIPCAAPLSSHQQSALAALVHCQARSGAQKLTLASFIRAYPALSRGRRCVLALNSEELALAVAALQDHGLVKRYRDQLTVTCDSQSVADQCHDQRLRALLAIPDTDEGNLSASAKGVVKKARV